MPDVTPTRSSTHYFEDTRFVTIQVEAKLFKLPASILIRRSGVFKQCLTIPAPSGDGAGDSDATAMKLEGISSDDFEYWLNYVFPSYAVEEFTIDALEAILKLSNHFMVPTGRQFAIDRLSCVVIRPARLLYMAVQYRVPKWFKASFEHLAGEALTTLEVEDLTVLQPTLLRQLIRIRRDVDKHRQLLAKSKPAAYRVQAGCDLDGGCVVLFRERWDNIAEPMLLSDFPHSPSEILRALSDWYTNNASICFTCRGFFTATLATELARERSIIAEGVAASYETFNFFENDDADEGVDPNM